MRWAILGIGGLAGMVFVTPTIQNARQRTYQTKMRKLATNSQKPFVLVSRSFAHGECLTIADYNAYDNQRTDYAAVEMLVETLSLFTPVVALGDRDILRSSAKNNAIFINEISFGQIAWLDVFVQLARMAKMIVVAPGTTNGVCDEIAALKEHGLLRRVAMMMYHTGGDFRTAVRGDTRWEWQSTARARNRIACIF